MSALILRSKSKSSDDIRTLFCSLFVFFLRSLSKSSVCKSRRPRKTITPSLTPLSEPNPPYPIEFELWTINKIHRIWIPASRIRLPLLYETPLGKYTKIKLSQNPAWNRTQGGIGSIPSTAPSKCFFRESKSRIGFLCISLFRAETRESVARLESRSFGFGTERPRFLTRMRRKRAAGREPAPALAGRRFLEAESR